MWRWLDNQEFQDVLDRALDQQLKDALNRAAGVDLSGALCEAFQAAKNALKARRIADRLAAAAASVGHRSTNRGAEIEAAEMSDASRAVARAVIYPRRCALESPEIFTQWLRGGKAPASDWEFKKLLPKKPRDSLPQGPMPAEADPIETNKGEK